MSDTLQRIYELKSQGVDTLLADINKVISRMDYLGQVKKNVFSGANMFGAPEAFAQMNAEIQKQVDLQMNLLNSLKAGNAERDKGAKIIEVQKGFSLKPMAPDGDYTAKIRAADMEAAVNRIYAQERKQWIAELTAATRQQEAAEQLKQKQMQQGEKMAADVGKANVKAAKDTIDAINAEIEADERLLALQMQLGEKMAAEVEKEMAAQEAKSAKEKEAYEKTQTALARLKAEYKAAADEAQELGAQQYLLQREADELAQIKAPSEQISFAAKNQELAEMAPKLADAQQKALDLSNALHTVEVATGQGQRKVGQYNEAVEGLRDILRDSPAFAMSFSTGLEGISNNIPMFLDGVKKMRTENAALVAEGKEPVSILATLGGAFTNIGTLATLAVTAITMFTMHMGEAKKEATDLKEATDSVTAAIVKEIEAITKYNDAIEVGTKAGEQAVKQELDNARAIGIINEEKYKYEKDLFDKQNAIFDKKKENLLEEKKLYDDLAVVLASSKYGANFDKILNGAAPEGTSTTTIEYLKKQREKAKKDGVSDSQLYDSLMGGNGSIDKQQSKLNADLEKLNDEKINAEAEFQAKYRLMSEAKHKELNKSIVQSDDELRLMQQKQYFESVDTITENVLAKYKIMYDDLARQRDQYIKENPSDGESISKYERLLNNLKLQADQERQNQVNAFLDQQAKTGRGYAVSETQSAAQIANLQAKGGVPAYDAFLAAAESESRAKVVAETKSYDDMYEAYVKNGTDTEELTRQHEARMRQIEREGYAQRLSIANTFFNTLSAETDKISAIFTQNIDTALLNKLSAITSGSGGKEYKDHAREMAEAQSAIDKANVTLRAVDIKLPDAEVAKKRNEADLQSAKTDEERRAAGEALLQTEKEITELLNQQAQAKNAIANATEQMNARAEAEKLRIKETLTNGAVDIAQQAAEAEMQLLAAQDAARDRSAQKQMAWNQKLLSSQVQSKQQQLANEKAFTIQQEQIEKEKAVRAQQRAKQQMMIEYAAAALKIVAANIWKGPEGWAEVAAEETVLTATYGAKLALLSAAPAYAGGTGEEGHPGGMAVVGDGKKKEIIEIGGQFFISPDKATSTWMPKGANVIPYEPVSDMTKLSSFSYPGTMGAQLTAPAYYSNHSGGKQSGWQDDGRFDAIAEGFAVVHNTMITVMAGIQNMNVSLDTNKLSSRLNYNTTKKVQL